MTVLAHAAPGGIHLELLLVGIGLIVLSLRSRSDPDTKRYVPKLLAAGGLVLIGLSFAV